MPQPIILKTDQPGLILTQMVSLRDDLEYLQLQQRNASHIAEFGNTVDSTVAEVTTRRISKQMVRFGIRMGKNLIGAVEYIPSDDELEAEVGIILDKDQTGNGIALSSLSSITAYLEPRFQRLYAEIDPKHERSLHLFARAGYVRQPDIMQREWGIAVVMMYARPTKGH